ncbi:4'-phosphopantetheinyl transferase family protein [Paenisporosarcina sp. NPDC076898]|uniref:4'-phosphopantetheinyl transferase family protein n=1 Tax=unclassified Paenisporosarcina TaxID=2642018 RepID=UPI003D0115DC
MVTIFIAKIESKISSEVFIKYILKKYLKIQGSVLIQKNKYGKPFLVNSPNIHYNISHTKGIMVCAISACYVGIDIERIKNFNKRIPKRFFTENEQNYIYSREEDQNNRFFEVWTRKEAYVKWIGKGLEMPLDSFDVLSIENIYTFSYGVYTISVCNKEFKQKSAIHKYCLIELGPETLF